MRTLSWRGSFQEDEEAAPSGEDSLTEADDDDDAFQPATGNVTAHNVSHVVAQS